MKILLSWLREFVDTTLSADDLKDSLTMAGVEVSGCRFLGEGFENVVVARILEQGRHPNADKLSLCKVTDGTREYSIVCGAKNMQPGDAVALARPGARLPSGIEIRKAKIRGAASEGMLCSEAEMGLADSSPGIMILGGAPALGTPLADALGLSDWILEVEITPNRGDCLSVLGVAREVSAVTDAPLRIPDDSVREDGPDIREIVRIGVSDRDLCPRYTARVVTGAAIGPSPEWMQRRLSLCGVRPINNIVDITNYMLLEAGQPMHAFDLDRLAGPAIDVRRSGIPRAFVTLDGIERNIGPDMLLIWDAERPVAVAGIMGGQNTEVLEGTTRVLFESAHFLPTSIRGTSKALGLSSESSYRFERGVDPSRTLWAANRAVHLLSKFAPFATARGVIDVGGDARFGRTVPFRPSRASKIVGRTYSEEECRTVFTRLGCDVEESGPGLLSVCVPPHRFDIEREIDLIEEAARIVGYDGIPATYPEAVAPHFSGGDRNAALVEKASDILISQGFSQAINFSFVSEKEWARHVAILGFDPGDAMRLSNPISDDTTMMRPSLLMGLLHNVQSNTRRFIDEIRLFEVGKAFGKRYEEGHFEEPRLGLVMLGRRVPAAWQPAGREPIDFYDLKGMLETLFGAFGNPTIRFVPSGGRAFLEEGKSADLMRDAETVGWCGAVRREICEALEIPGTPFYAEVRLAEIVSFAGPAKFTQIQKFPPVFRDFACVLPSAVPVGDVLAMVRESSEEIESAAVFDVFTGEKIGEGKKSVAFRVKLQPRDRTLTEAEVHSIQTKIIDLLENRFGGKIRG